MAQEIEQAPTQEEPQGPSKFASVRQRILLIILGLAVVALIWEYAVARPQSEKAWAKVDELQTKNYSSGGEVTNTNETVRETIGKTASARTEAENEVTEIYRWRRGLPVWAYEIHVVYSKTEDGQLLLKCAHLNSDPKDVLQTPDPNIPAEIYSQSSSPKNQNIPIESGNTKVEPEVSEEVDNLNQPEDK